MMTAMLGGWEEMKSGLGKPLRSRFDLDAAEGVGRALREIYPPDGAADAQFERLLNRLTDTPSGDAGMRGKSHAGH